MNRRRNAADSGERQATNRKIAALSPTAFRQALIKCSQRFVRQGRGFALAALQVLEFEQVKRAVSVQAAEQLSNLASTTFLQTIRGADRLCASQSGHFLLLMPDTDTAGAQVAVDRLSQLVSSAKSHFKHKPLRASCSSRIAHCEQFFGDSEAMLACLGYCFDSQGELNCPTSLAVGQEEITASPGLGGGFASWLERYEDLRPTVPDELGEVLKLSRLAAKDRWSAGCPVQLRVIENLAGTIFDTDVLAVLLRRSKVIQAIDHPGVASAIDFQVRDRRSFYLVSEHRLEPSLTDFLAAAGAVDFALIADWAVQICNSLIYLQSLMPPVVPPVLLPGCFVVTPEQHLILVDYEVPYLFPSCHQGFELSGSDIQAVTQGRPIPAYEPVVRSLGRMLGRLAVESAGSNQSLSRLFDRLQADQLPTDLNTIYKIRSALRAST
jgi:GGDEF domain-containing protein